MFGNDPDRDWERYGAEDPYYSILNTESYRRHRLDAAGLEEIFRSGEERVDEVLHFAERRFGAVARRNALEFGCGVGRLLLPLGRRFEQVVGLDVSPSMLREAERHLQRVEATNVRLVASDDELAALDGTFDFMLSYLVFQHIPVRRGERILRGLLARLNLGGTAAFHLAIHRNSSRTRQWIHVLRRNFRPLHVLANLVGGMRWNEPLMQSNLYRFERILAIASEEGVLEMALHPVQHSDHVGIMLYLHRGSVPGEA